MRYLLCLAALAVTGCAGGAHASSAPAARAVSLPSGMAVPQVLSLSMDPADGALFAATDRGLLRIPRGGRRATRIDGSYEGVTLRRDSPVEFVGPGQLLGSGHPAKASYKLPDDLGLLLSDDTGRTWHSIGLIGEADLHLLHPAGRRLWAYDLVGQTFVLTRDNGATFTRPSSPGAVTDFAVDPSDDRHLVAVTEQGLLETRDEGGGWRPAGDPEAQHVVWPRKDLLLTTGGSGEVRSSSDGGGSFSHAGRLAAPAEAPLMRKGGVLYAALKGGRIQRSKDDGQTWSTVIRLVTR